MRQDSYITPPEGSWATPAWQPVTPRRRRQQGAARELGVNTVAAIVMACAGLAVSWALCALASS